jgi:proteasome accessory factor C
MLSLVPWILSHPGVTIPELAARFEIDERQIERDLELLPMCGLPPYTADRLIDVWVADDGAVTVRLAEYFERPLRLTPAEGIGLVAAGRALLAVPGADRHGPLATALEKLEDALGARGGVAVDVGDTGELERLREAVAARQQLEIDYFSFARDEMTTRVVDPMRVFHAFGEWYLGAYCHRAEADRLFRVDRIRAVRATGETIAPERSDPGDELDDVVYTPSPDDVRVTLRVAPEAAWVAEELPVESVTPRAKGRLDVVLPVSAVGFLERLLLGLGPDAEVVAPRDARSIAADAASRVLERYEGGS